MFPDIQKQELIVSIAKLVILQRLQLGVSQSDEVLYDQYTRLSNFYNIESEKLD